MRVFDWKLSESWPSFLGKRLIVDGEIDESLIEEFYDNYTHVKTYHSCRPIEAKLYLKEGLKISNYSQLMDRFVENIQRYCGIKIEKKYIESARNEFGHFHDKRLFVVLDDENLLYWAGHYAIYGSEYLVGVANHIESHSGLIGKDCLKSFGVPTVYEILLDINDITVQNLSSLVNEINNAIFNDEQSYSIDFTFELYKPLASECLIGCYHPTEIRDPLEQFRLYTLDNC